MQQPLMHSIQQRLTTTNLVASAAALLTIGTSQAAQVATDPGDYSPLPAGVDLGLVYFQHAERDEVYSNGKELAVNTRLSTDIGLLRWVHFMEIGGLIADPQVILPLGKVDLEKPLGSTPAMSSSGIGDPMVGGTLWLLNNPVSQQAFGVTALLSLPLGKYDADQGPVNVGENRFKLVTQAAWVTPLSDQFSLDLIAEYSLFGDNDDFVGMTREQAPQYGWQSHLSYHLSDSTRLAASYLHDFGGETTVAAAKQDDALNNSRWMLGVSHFIAADKQLQLQYGQDLKTESGFQESNRLNLRLVQVF